MGYHSIMYIFKNISALFLTGGDNRPGSLAPTHAIVAAGALGNMAIYHHMPNSSFRNTIL